MPIRLIMNQTTAWELSRLLLFTSLKKKTNIK